MWNIQGSEFGKIACRESAMSMSHEKASIIIKGRVECRFTREMAAGTKERIAE